MRITKQLSERVFCILISYVMLSPSERAIQGQEKEGLLLKLGFAMYCSNFI